MYSVLCSCTAGHQSGGLMTAHATHEVFAAVGISDYFELRTGARFRIPSWAIRTLKSSTSSNRDERTPMTLQFMWPRRMRRSGFTRGCFFLSNHELRQGKRGRIMFVPGDLEAQHGV